MSPFSTGGGRPHFPVKSKNDNIWMFERSNQSTALNRIDESTVQNKTLVISCCINYSLKKFQSNKQLLFFSFFSSKVLIELECACLFWSLPVLVNILTSEHTDASVDSQGFFVFKTLVYLLLCIFPILIINFAETHIYGQEIKAYKATEG